MKFTAAQTVLSLFTLLTTTLAQDTHTGTLFFFIPELGACGFTNNSNQLVASVSTAFFNGFPGATGESDENPICQRQLLVTSGTTNVIASIVDSSDGSGPLDVGLSPPGFEAFAPLRQGEVPDVTWEVI